MKNPEYESEGYAIARGLFSVEEIAIISAEANRVFAKRDLIDFRACGHSSIGEMLEM